MALMECDKVASADLQGKHFVHFIAHDRTVHSQKIDSKIGLEYFGNDGDKVFHAVLSGEYFDENVNQQRAAFQFEDAVIDRGSSMMFVLPRFRHSCESRLMI